MSYCTQQQLEDRYGTERIAELTRDAQGQTVLSDLAEDAIDDFAAQIDAALRVFNDPADFDSTNTLLNGMNIEGAYLLLWKWSEGGWTEDQLNEWKMLKGMLDDISANKLRLTSETEDQKEERIEGFFKSNTRLFGRTKDSLRDMGLSC